MTTLIIGSKGRLAQACKYYLSNAEQLSISIHEMVYEVIRDHIIKVKPSAIVNCAAYTNVDRAEIEQMKCHDANVKLVNTLVNIAEHLDIPLVQYSSDFVFGNLPTEGRVKRRVLTDGYMVHDLPNPISYYGNTKHVSELLVRQYKKGIVIRTCGIYSHYKEDFLSKFLSLIPQPGDPRPIPELPVCCDGYCNPTAADDLAIATNSVLKKGMFGLFNAVSPEPASWLDFFRAALIMTNQEHALTCIRLLPLHAVKNMRQSDIAARPLYSVLGTGELESQGIVLPTWRESLFKYCQEIKDQPAAKAKAAQAVNKVTA